MLLESIKKENDIHCIPKNRLNKLADEIRTRIIDVVSQNGGHLASNLGTVELTIALHYVLDFPKDKLIWDVGHQAYTHKILTGRNKDFDTLRQYQGLSGFPKRNENDSDCFNTGHSSTSISAGLGFVWARDILKEKNTVVSVIGDGSLTGGLAYEALNNLSDMKSNYIIILNDNDFSISSNIGGVSKMLNNVRTADSYLNLKSSIEKKLEKTSTGYKLAASIRNAKSRIKQILIPGTLFENMGITYLGPVDGHNIEELINVMNRAKKLKHGVIIHVKTIKGKGYKPAEMSPDRFHGIGPFNKIDGTVRKSSGICYSKVFSNKLVELAETNTKIVAVSAAMSDGTGLSAFQKRYPNRFFDVGIAEQHAVTFSAGLCAAGLKPVTAIFSSFLQRAFDEILHDVCMQKLPVVFMIDRAGLVGSDGQTHHGCYDLSYLSLMPNMTIMAPKCASELEDMLEYAVNYQDGPIAIRYPKGEAFTAFDSDTEPIVYGKWETIRHGADIAIIATGAMFETGIEVSEKLKKHKNKSSLINARFVKPIDEDLLIELSEKHKIFAVIEDNTLKGGLGEQICEAVNRLKLNSHVMTFAIPDEFVEQGTISQLRLSLELDSDSITQAIIRKAR